MKDEIIERHEGRTGTVLLKHIGRSWVVVEDLGYMNIITENTTERRARIVYKKTAKKHSPKPNTNDTTTNNKAVL